MDNKNIDNNVVFENFNDFMEEVHYYFSNEALTKEKFHELIKQFKLPLSKDNIDRDKDLFFISDIIKASFYFCNIDGKETFSLEVTLPENNIINWGTKPALKLKYRNTKNIKYKGEVFINNNFLLKDILSFKNNSYTSKEEKDMLSLFDIEYSGVDRLKVLLNKIYNCQKPLITINLEKFLIQEKIKTTNKINFK